MAVRGRQHPTGCGRLTAGSTWAGVTGDDAGRADGRGSADAIGCGRAGRSTTWRRRHRGEPVRRRAARWLPPRRRSPQRWQRMQSDGSPRFQQTTQGTHRPPPWRPGISVEPRTCAGLRETARARDGPAACASAGQGGHGCRAPAHPGDRAGRCQPARVALSITKRYFTSPASMRS